MSGADNGYEWLNGKWVDVHSEEYAGEVVKDRLARFPKQNNAPDGCRCSESLNPATAVSRVQSVFASHRNPIRFAVEQRGDYIALAANGRCNVPQEQLELALGRSVSIFEDGGKVGILIHPESEECC